MDRKITELDSIEQIQGDEYFVIASKQYNENYKVKVQNFIDQMDFITVDDELSLTSTNPVQNRVITEKLNELDDRLDNIDGGNDSSTNFDLVVASVETETLPAGKQANVEITDLGTVDNIKSLAFSFAIPKGADGAGGGTGGDGSDSKAREFIYTRTEEEKTPNKPSNNPYVDDYVPRDEGWEDHPQGISEDILCEWVCTRTYNDSTGVWNNWEGPALWAKYGVNGKDGDGVEYIYQLSSNYDKPATPGRIAASHSPVTSYQEREFIPAKASTDEFEWQNNPSDVTISIPYQWVSVRKFNWKTQLWGDFEEPTLWAKYGKDGDEAVAAFKSFVFRRTNVILTSSDTPKGGNYASPIPTTAGWSDGVPDGSEILWMSSRIFTANGGYPQQDVWTVPKQMTDTANFDVEFSSMENPGAPTGHPNQNANWSNTSDSTTIWMATSTMNNGVWSDWQMARIRGEKGDAGTSINILGSFDSYEELLATVTDPNMGDCYLINGELYVWDGDEWINVGLIQGPQGPAGNGIKQVKQTYQVHTNGDTPPTGTWLDSSPATNDTYKYLWRRTIFTYTNVGDLATDNLPIYEVVGVHGAKGIDGESIQFAFKLTTDKKAPNPPETDVEGSNNIGEWTDDPQMLGNYDADDNWVDDDSSITVITYKYQWVSQRTKTVKEEETEGTWGDWSDATLWSELYPGTYLHIKYSNDIENEQFTDNNGEDVGKYIGMLVDYNIGDSGDFDDYTWRKFEGNDGFGREYIFKLNNDYNNPPKVPIRQDGDNTPQFKPTGWNLNPVIPTTNNRYCWCCHRDGNGNEWGDWTGNSTNTQYAYLFSMYAESVKGDTGQDGPILFPAGYWESEKLYEQILREDESVQATPYVYDVNDNTYYYLIAESVQSSTRPVNDTLHWKKMATFNAIYTDILLANNAKVGQAVFNGDYMFSQKGINPQTNVEGEYTRFNLTGLPYTSESTFDPNWCVNLRTGEQWIGAGKSYFAASGAGYLANKQLSWNSDGDLYIGFEDNTAGAARFDVDGTGYIANGNIKWKNDQLIIGESSKFSNAVKIDDLGINVTDSGVLYGETVLPTSYNSVEIGSNYITIDSISSLNPKLGGSITITADGITKYDYLNDETTSTNWPGSSGSSNIQFVSSLPSSPDDNTLYVLV